MSLFVPTVNASNCHEFSALTALVGYPACQTTYTSISKVSALSSVLVASNEGQLNNKKLS